MGLFSRKDHIAEWNNISDDEKTNKIKLEFDCFISGYLRVMFMKQSPKEVDNYIENMKITADNEDWFTMYADQTSAYYKETNSNTSSGKVIKNFIKGHVRQLIGVT